MRLLQALLNKQLVTYILVGLFATIVDWSTFSIVIHSFNYQLSLMLALGAGGLTHYLANKKLTFQCQSRQYGRQISIYIFLAIMNLVFSLLLLTALIKYFAIPKVAARMLTTLLLLFPNYLLHKNITFNKSYF